MFIDKKQDYNNKTHSRSKWNIYFPDTVPEDFSTHRKQVLMHIKVWGEWDALRLSLDPLKPSVGPLNSCVRGAKLPGQMRDLPSVCVTLDEETERKERKDFYFRFCAFMCVIAEPYNVWVWVYVWESPLACVCINSCLEIKGYDVFSRTQQMPKWFYNHY